ncbi:MAG: hypothetical protein EPO55_17170 [Reyranella sp.]|uniref:hypothetical protein n=1 Tax=Reyranella sp. TaxID=1929291 RepID=UPI00120D3D3B|nr:hypothetical protein [Reyranella sp.]TAJ37955.1 MAG: hypothetical protein EPO55_17170 [Reyranella sp.]
MGWSKCPIDEVPAEVLAERPPAPRKRTLARKKYDYERHLARWGNHADAAARTGVDERTARRWRAEPGFRARCDLALKFYRETIEMETHRRVETPQVKPIWYRGRQVGHIRRFNDRLLLRLIARMPLPPEND